MHLLTHFPKLSTCEICSMSKTQRAPCRRKKHKPGDGQKEEAGLEEVKTFGDLITADHIIVGDGDASHHGDRAAMVLLDAASKWIDCFPTATKSTEDNMQSLQNYVGPTDQVKYFYSNGASEITSALKSPGMEA